MKSIYIRLALLALLLILVFGLQYAIGHSEPALLFYIRHIFLPLQRGRSYLFNGIPLSVGDILYLILALLLLLILIRSVYFLFTYRKNKTDFWIELLRFLTLPLAVYTFFLFFWGGNYARPPLAAGWDLKTLKWDTSALIQLNRSLVQRMNEEQVLQPRFADLKTLNSMANTYYHERFGNRLPRLQVKPTSLGYMLNYLGIQGYYNPLSGEAQFNRFIPRFMHPFVLTHEMAHQAGIAAEDDANLMAYIICVESKNTAFRYSAYFNLFLYAYADLKAKDSLVAKGIFATLNQQSKNDMDTLRAMNKRYRSKFRLISTSLYDDYLKLHGQRDGINTYNDVTRWVYFWEHTDKKRANLMVCP